MHEVTSPITFDKSLAGHCCATHNHPSHDLERLGASDLVRQTLKRAATRTEVAADQRLCGRARGEGSEFALACDIGVESREKAILNRTRTTFGGPQQSKGWLAPASVAWRPPARSNSSWGHQLASPLAVKETLWSAGWRS
jgi:hypothetical protein